MHTARSYRFPPPTVGAIRIGGDGYSEDVSTVVSNDDESNNVVAEAITQDAFAAELREQMRSEIHMTK